MTNIQYTQQATCRITLGSLNLVVDWDNIRTIPPTKTSCVTQKAIRLSIDISSLQGVALLLAQTVIGQMEIESCANITSDASCWQWT